MTTLFNNAIFQILPQSFWADFVHFYPNVTTLRSDHVRVVAIANPSVVCLSVCRLYRSCALPRRLKLSAIFLRHFVPRLSFDFHVQFYGDSRTFRPLSIYRTHERNTQWSSHDWTTATQHWPVCHRQLSHLYNGYRTQRLA